MRELSYDPTDTSEGAVVNEKHPIYSVYFLRSEVEMSKQSKMSAFPEKLSLRISLDTLYEKVEILSLLPGTGQKLVNC